MYTLVVVLLTVLITTGSFLFGYWLANYHRELSDLRWFEDLTIDDYLTGTPIASKLDREYGYESRNS
jgi:hypothetical protein